VRLEVSTRATGADGSMELLEFRASGIRCLGAIEWIPVASPTILTGANDGGKTSVLMSLAFLLTGRGLVDQDFTLLLPDESPTGPTSDGRYAECSTEGRFLLDDNELAELDLPKEVTFRRRSEAGGTIRLEVRKQVAADARLRELPSRSLANLKAVAEELGVGPAGPANQKASYVSPLQALADCEAQVNDWVTAPAAVAERLPRLVHFASTAEPDPETEIREALREAYSRALEDPLLVGPVRKAEDQVRRRLEE
jgi:hypothetical protein